MFLKAEGGILERHFLLLKGRVINDHRRHHVDVSSLEGFRMALRVKRKLRSKYFEARSKWCIL